MRHDKLKIDHIGDLYRWSDSHQRVEWWEGSKWYPSDMHDTTVTIPMNQLVSWEDTWCEPFEGMDL